MSRRSGSGSPTRTCVKIGIYGVLAALAGERNRQSFMTRRDVHNAIRVDRACGTAISGIGVRLRINLAGEHDRLPQHLISLIGQMAAISAPFQPRLRVTK